ncbi:MAG: glycosyltransferase family 9 protein [Tannerella sp.]|jgi:ADP-heptose:LPS heptosyltransferase|nr:glycosyltransferase family 9 protein [Tannerella sp.]
MSKALIIRLSAIGDVAMTIPVLYSAALANPSDEFTMLTQQTLLPLFINAPANLHLIAFENDDKPFFRFLKFAIKLAGKDFDAALDLHNVIRSRIISLLFSLKGRKVFTLDKLRREQRLLTRKPPKTVRPLRPVVQRYKDVFHAAGFQFDLIFSSLFETSTPPLPRDIPEKQGLWIGVAPFAKHRGKIYPTEKMRQVLEMLTQRRDDLTVFLFGGGEAERSVLEGWAADCPRTVNVAGRYSLGDELALISRLDVMLCMDSANMHFASLVGVRAVSVWGATHPAAGFFGYRQPAELAIQAALPCRPCSIYGNRPCYRGDYDCMNSIMPEEIYLKMINSIPTT